MAAYARDDRQVTGALRAMRDVADAMAEALRAADLARVAKGLGENWRLQQALDPEMRTPEMARLERALADAGALGGKAAGAGAGGAVVFVAGGGVRPPVAAGRGGGGPPVPLRWAATGVRAW